MPSPIRPDELSSEDRLREIAALLAAGVLRFSKDRYRATASNSECEKLSESAARGLDGARAARLSVHDG